MYPPSMVDPSGAEVPQVKIEEKSGVSASALAQKLTVPSVRLSFEA